MEELYVLVWVDADLNVLTAICPGDENPGHEDQVLMVYRSKEAAEAAATYQMEQFGCTENFAAAVKLSGFIASR